MDVNLIRDAESRLADAAIAVFPYLRSSPSPRGRGTVGALSAGIFKSTAAIRDAIDVLRWAYRILRRLIKASSLQDPGYGGGARAVVRGAIDAVRLTYHVLRGLITASS